MGPRRHEQHSRAYVLEYGVNLRLCSKTDILYALKGDLSVTSCVVKWMLERYYQCFMD